MGTESADTYNFPLSIVRFLCAALFLLICPTHSFANFQIKRWVGFQLVLLFHQKVVEFQVFGSRALGHFSLSVHRGLRKLFHRSTKTKHRNSTMYSSHSNYAGKISTRC